MQWELIVALVIAIPVILFPAAFIWYINIGGIYAAIKEARAKRAVIKSGARVEESILSDQEYERALIENLKRHPWL